LSVKRISQSANYFSGKQQQQRSARANLEFIIENKRYLLNVRNGKKHLVAALNMSDVKDDLTDNQINYVTSIYEKVMEGAGFESCKTKHDFVKKLKY